MYPTQNGRPAQVVRSVFSRTTGENGDNIFVS